MTTPHSPRRASPVALVLCAIALSDASPAAADGPPIAGGAPPAAAPADPVAVPEKGAEAKRKLEGLLERMKSTDLAARKAAVAEAKDAQDAAVTAALSHALSDADDAVRLAAIAALAARTEAAGKKSAALALAARLPRISEKPTTFAELLKALEALHNLAQPATLKAIADRLGLDVSPEELAARLRAIANVPAAEAIDTIIDFRASGGKLGGRQENGYRRRMAREAFQYATGNDTGHDPDAMRAWWKEHQKGFDFAAAAARRAKEGGGPKAKPGDGMSPDTGNK